MDAPERRVLARGQFAQLIAEGHWEYVARVGSVGAAVILAVTDDGRAVLTEQRRIPVGRAVIEWPAGLVGDPDAPAGEGMLDAARRELLEETGYEALRMTPLAHGPPSAGLAAETVWMVRAEGLRKRHAGGGTHTEAITVHEVPLAEIDAWLRRMESTGRLVDIKVYAGLYLLGHARSR